MLPRFVKQRNNYSCGYVALINMKKALLYKSSLKDIAKYKKNILRSKYNYQGLTYFELEYLIKTDKNLSKHFRATLYNLNIKDINKLSKYFFFILTTDGDPGHYSVLISSNNKYFLINYRGTITILNKKQMSSALKITHPFKYGKKVLPSFAFRINYE